MTDEQDRCSLCPEQIKTGSAMTWICCDVCETWYHVRCLGMSVEEFEVIDRYHCQSCTTKAGPSTLLRKSSRKQGKINYADLVNGVVSHQSKWRVLLESNQFLQDKFERIEHAENLTLDWLRETGFKAPIIVPSGASSTVKGEHAPATSLEGLDMKMPPSSMTVDDVRDLVGPETPVEVMDVATQSELLDWNMRDWADYFKTEPKERVYNVISLEITGTELAKQVQRPKIVRELDWVENFWPESLSPTEFPKVQLYCLMSVKESFTDFHIDFAGSSVFYHILSGAKTFYFVEPTSTHLRKYAKWSSSADQSTTFFGDEVAGKCYKVDLQQGDTMFIPAGWIHAVHTPLSSVVIGGNFIHSLHVPMQYRVASIEIETNVPPKFRFPFFEKLNWFVALGYLERGRNYLSTLSDTELCGIMSVTMHLYTRQQQLTGTTKTESRKSRGGPVSKEERHLIRASVPAQVASFDQGGPLGLLRLLNSEVKSILESRIEKKAGQGISNDIQATLSDSLKHCTLPTAEQEIASRSSSRSSSSTRRKGDGTGSDQDTSASESTELAKEITPKLKLKLNLKVKARTTEQFSSGEEEGESSHGEQQVPGSTTKKTSDGSISVKAEEAPKPKLKLKLSTVIPQSTTPSSQSSKRTRKASQRKKAALEDDRLSATEMDPTEGLTSDDEWDAFENELENDLDSASGDDGELEPGSSDSEYEGSAPKRAPRSSAGNSNNNSSSKAQKRRGSSASQGGASMTFASQERVKVAPSEVFFDEEDDSMLDQDDLQDDLFRENTKKQKVDPEAPVIREIRSLGGLSASSPLPNKSSSGNKRKVAGSTAKDRIKNLLMKRR